MLHRLLPALLRVYTIAVTPARPKLIRTLCMTIVVIFMYLRCSRLLLRPIPLALLMTLWSVFGLVQLSIAALVVLFIVVHRHPDDGIGHRVGVKGYNGEYFENTLEALRDLASRDAQGEFNDQHLPFIEFDVQESGDGQLVIFHDPGLTRAFPEVGPNVEPWKVLRHIGFDPSTVTIKDLTAAQLSTLHLGGQEGLRVPTLQEFLRTCQDCDVRRTLAVEVKFLHSDAARAELIYSLVEYKNARVGALKSTPDASRNLYTPFGWVGIIAFPQLFASAFGEYGSAEWQRWAGEMRRYGLPARCCHFHWCDLTFGAAETQVKAGHCDHGGCHCCKQQHHHHHHHDS